MILSLALAAAQPTPPPEETDCSYDLEAMLALDQQAFDQELDGGWRILDNAGCEAEAAELIREWRHKKRSHASILYWHEGQMRANAGQSKQAIALFSLTYKAPAFDADFGWNHYVDGTIAFLSRDKDRLVQAIENLKAVPKPADYQNTVTLADGTVVEFSWPPNLKVLEAFERCWDKTYKEAYGRDQCSEREKP